MRDVAELSVLWDLCEGARREGRTVSLVPTMGALHAGHASLMDAAAPDSFCVVSVFVNPLQFGAGEDLDRYPRTLDADRALCASHGVDALFAPAPNAVFPDGFSSQVRVGGLTDRLEGVHRPGHFDGMTTIVAKLFGMVGKSTAYFGQKDYQQLQIVKRMARDLNLPIKIVGCPIVREDDGLARSSRNRYLSPDERARALSLSRGLAAAESLWAKGIRDRSTLEHAALGPVEAAADRVDYVEAVHPESLEPYTGGPRCVVLVAAHVGSTRLIDNRVLD